MARRVLVALALATAVALVSGGAAAGSARTGGGGSAARPVAFVPLGGFPRADAQALARELGSRLGLEMRVLERAAMPRSAFDRRRKQWVAEELVDVVASRRPSARANEVLIGLTIEDMHTRAVPNWRFSFSIRHPSGLAVVSRARMDPKVLGLAPDPDLRARRLRKMVLKNVGLLALGLSQSRNPRSVLYDVILSTDDLDFMTEEFRPRSPSRAQRLWLGRTQTICDRGVAEGKSLIARSPVTTPEELLAFGRQSIALEDRTRARLAAVSAPAEDRTAVVALLGLFRRSVDVDRAFVAKLTASWSDETLRRWLRDGLRNSIVLKSRALELGTRACARYFDPATYVR